MSKPDQVLQIEPQNELRFRGPFNVSVTSYMKLTNPSDKKVMFKIKTTAPKKYCVRPNSGILEPNSNIEIAICLQPFLFDPAEKNKHKFMVQTIYAPDGDVNMDQIWKEMQPDQLMDSKLKCVFELPMDQNETEADIAKSSPKFSSTFAPAANSIDPDLQKVAQEVQQLKEEENLLKQENIQLKEEILQLKQQIGVNHSVHVNRYVPPVQQEPSIPNVYVALAVLLGFIGLILGKYAL